jgi:hypothetical protein
MKNNKWTNILLETMDLNAKLFLSLVALKTELETEPNECNRPEEGDCDPEQFMSVDQIMRNRS